MTISKVLFFTILQLVVTNVHAQDLGLKSYDLKNYAAAIQHWSDPATQPIGAAQHYNLGCAHFKNGNPGLALAHFGKAMQLHTKFDELMHRIDTNFSLVQSNVFSRGLVPQTKSLWPYKFRYYAQKLKPEWLYILGSVFISLAVCILLFKKGGYPWPLVTVLCLLGTVNVAVAGIMDMSQQVPLAYVAADVIPVRSGPGEQFTELWQLPAGTLVQVKSKKSENWQQINTDGKGVGWVVENNLIRL